MPTNTLSFYDFDSAVNPILDRHTVGQYAYLFFYLHDLGAKTVVKESVYFDRDYLSEFASFYAINSASYPNYCQRLHFFCNIVTLNDIELAATGNEDAHRKLQECYLGFCIIRPVRNNALGKTVLRWYPDNQKSNTPRITEPSRKYICHLAGIELSVNSLAWQQQDTGVSACATIAIWTILQSSAFSDFTAIPTTTEITKRAHLTASLGQRIFPSNGLTLEQIGEAVKESGLSPLSFSGDVDINGTNHAQHKGFSRRRFCALGASLIRSGYPILIGGYLGNLGLHAVCGVAFRDNHSSTIASGGVYLHDEGIEYFYIHDDNIGPAARFRVVSDNPVVLEVDKPMDYSTPFTSQVVPQYNPGENYHRFTPTYIMSATQNDMRLPVDSLNDSTARFANLYAILARKVIPNVLINIGVVILKLSNFLKHHLQETLGSKPEILGRVRMALYQDFPAMALHIGVGRIASESTPLIDILCDCTEGIQDGFPKIYGYLSYDIVSKIIIENLIAAKLVPSASIIEVY